MTWNIDMKAMSRRRLEQVVSVIEQERPDLLALQEVGVGWEEDLEDLLPKIGLPHVLYGRRRKDRLKYGNLVASRYGMTVPDTRVGNYPELLQHVHLAGTDFVHVHIPNGTGFEWEKIEHHRVLRSVIESVTGPVAVAGDFNAPAMESPEKALGFGVEVLHEGRWKTASTARDSLGWRDVMGLPFRYWKGDESGTGETWESTETWIFNRSDEHGLIDAYRALHPVAEEWNEGYSFRFNHGDTKRHRRFDHLFVSPHWQPQSARYVLAALEQSVSDHAPLVVDLSAARR